MNDRSLRVLEFNKVRELLADQAVSGAAKKLALKLEPSDDVREIEYLQKETSEAAAVIVQKGTIPIGGINEIVHFVKLAEKGGTLSPKELLEIKQNLYTARNIVSHLKSDVEPGRIIADYAAGITVCKREEEEIDRCILSEDQIADGASAELRSIRRAIIRKNEELRAKMSHIIQSRDNKDILQDSIITIRQGRYVIPVKQEHRGRVAGIVHDQSATGATLFIEPQAIVNLNNEMRELQLKEEAEVARILQMLSGMVAVQSNGIIANQEILVKLDFAFAKAKLALQMKAIEPVLNDDGYIIIKEGRHPLIDRKTVVPMSVSLGKDYDTLVITGPNTGGKTVTLKTVGLMVLMTQAGLHIPAEIGTRMTVFKEVFADIGDEQSIEQSLSTFSSHMKNIVDIVSKAGLDCLVLLDELGAGTDPTEGAALAISVLDYLLGRGAKTMATTHYTELKKYALTTRNVENGCMEFDVNTLSPTYKLIIGMAGKSNAFEISEKLGLPAELIGEAKKLLEKGDIEFEDLISEIAMDRKRAEEERDEAVLINIELKKMREDLEKQKEKFAVQKEKIMARAKEEARDMVKEMKEFSDNVFKELRELEKINDPKARNRKFEEVRKKVKGKSEEYAQNLDKKENRNPIGISELRPGVYVYLVNIDQEGTVLTEPDSKGDLMVQVGLMKVSANAKDLQKLKDAPSEKQIRSKYAAMYKEKTANVSTSFDVRGNNLDAAEVLVDKYIDDAFMAGLKQVTIIHGKGEGVLREGLKSLFKKNRHVDKFRPGMINEGGAGVTVLLLK
ncbi:MAG: endonuclease MutS2 [Bacillota bacterium]|nr:endonuclease MutS2 [Bacillota bacterium]